MKAQNESIKSVQIYMYQNNVWISNDQFVLTKEEKL